MATEAQIKLKDHISHIPKVVTQHGIFLSTKDAPVIAAKPGQGLYDRDGFYTTEVKLSEKNFIQHQLKDGNEYDIQYNKTVKSKDYTNPQKPLIPAALLVHQKKPGEEEEKPKGPTFEANWEQKLSSTLSKAPTEATAGLSGGASGPSRTGAAIWSSTYRETTNKDGYACPAECKNYVRLRGPKFQVAHPPTCLAEEPYTSSYAADYGAAGSIPTEKLVIPSYNYDGRIAPKEDGHTRVIDERAVLEKTLMAKVGDVAKEGRVGDEPDLPKESINKFVTLKTELTRGTTRGTFHIPGYQGYLPMNTANSHCAKIECGINEREKWYNLAEQYHLNIPGYTGHLPLSSINDKGSRQVASMTTYNRDYARSAGIQLQSEKK
ncbi:unnamed protein product [Amoebophrya sp. A120]|nr:unnamed protein product [Amoebophrya sp. A120]|eukprot:GSA120T00017921001.1